MFVNRTRELELLENRYRSGQAEFFVMYGRRRVGKTELLTRFCDDKQAIFFVADLSSEVSSRTALSKAINAILFGPGQVNAVYETWEDLFVALAKAAESTRLVVVFDEFPYLVAAYPPIGTILQRIWDQVLKHSKIMLVLCGSYIGMMEESVLGYQAPLYGRRTAQYLLEPLRFHDARLFYPHFDLVDQVRAYAVYGGTPAYLNTVQPKRSLNDNILGGILTRGAFLYDEARFLLQQELREPRNYFAILQAIAAGKTRLNEIKQGSGVDGANAYLDILQHLHLVQRLVPVTETQPQKSRRGIYRLKDPFIRFWFRYVQPNRSQLERGIADRILNLQVIPEIDHFSALAFEEICQQYLWRMAEAGKLPFQPVDIGNWWNGNEEIDLVALGQETAMLVECKWSSHPIGINILQELERKSDRIRPELGDRRIVFGFCSRAGFTEALLEIARGRVDLHLFNLPAIIDSEQSQEVK